jgi:hypothetical protein
MFVGESIMIHLKKALSTLTASILLTLASCAPNNGFTLIYASEQVTNEFSLEINKDTCHLRVIRPEYTTTTSCIKYVEYDYYAQFEGFGDGPYVFYYFPTQFGISVDNLVIVYLPNNTQIFPDSRFKTINWYFGFSN